MTALLSLLMVLGTGLGIVGYWLTVGRRRRADVPVQWFQEVQRGFMAFPPKIDKK
jgi:hypothetical protein